MHHSLNTYQIWIGYYNLGKNYSVPTEPKMVGEEKAPNFRVACVLHAAKSYLNYIKYLVDEHARIGEPSCRWSHNFKTNSNVHTGKYFETKEEAEKSFITMKLPDKEEILDMNSFSNIPALQFAEWIAYNYVRENGYWIHRYSDPMNKDNQKNTDELFLHWMENIQNKPDGHCLFKNTNIKIKNV